MAAVVRLPVSAMTAPGPRPSCVSASWLSRATPLPTSGFWAPATWRRTASVRGGASLGSGWSGMGKEEDRKGLLARTARCEVRGGPWSVVRGAWSVVRGPWSVVSGQWSVASGATGGGRSSPVLCLLLSVSCPLPPVHGRGLPQGAPASYLAGPSTALAVKSKIPPAGRPLLVLPLVLLVLGAAAWLAWPRAADQPSDRPIRSPHGVSGAAEALVWWELQRAYPSGVFPSRGLAAAFAQRRALQAGEPRGGDVWESMGPTNNGGRTLAVALNPLRGETVWLGSAGGGIWRSYDAGLNASWHRVATGLPITSATAIAIAPADTSVVYVGTGEVYRYQDVQGGIVERPTRGSYGIGILKTEDGGATWSLALDWSLNQERGVARIRVNPNDPDDVWAATTEGVLRSTDGGQTWANVHPVIMAMDIVLRPDDPNWAIASHGDQESEGKGIYRTTDGGATWE